MITLCVNYYAEDPEPAIQSAKDWIPAIDRVVAIDGRYDGFPDLDGGQAPVYGSEHEKRNAILAAGMPWASRDRWLLWLDCDERVTYASPQLPAQLEAVAEDNAALRFIHPLPPDASLIPGFGQPGRSMRDRVIEPFPGRLFRHLSTLEFQHRHDYLVDTASGRGLMGWQEELVAQPRETVDLELVHLWWSQDAERVAAKGGYYAGPVRTAESKLRVGRNVPAR